MTQNKLGTILFQRGDLFRECMLSLCVCIAVQFILLCSFILIQSILPVIHDMANLSCKYYRIILIHSVLIACRNIPDLIKPFVVTSSSIRFVKRYSVQGWTRLNCRIVDQVSTKVLMKLFARGWVQ